MIDMRPIEFRGKDKKTEKWVYGDLCQIQKRTFISEWEDSDRVKIAPDIASKIYFTFQVAEVDPATVGQYINREDKIGKKIFKGDLLEHRFETKILPMQRNKIVKSPGFTRILIGYKNSCFTTSVVAQENSYYGEIPEEQGSSFHVDFENVYTIIGNVHDNPELLEEAT